MRNIATKPLRSLLGYLTSSLPSREHGGIELAVVAPMLEASADRFFERTSDALKVAERHAPRAYAALREDTERIVLVAEPAGDPYSRYQKAIAVSRDLLFAASTTEYAAWLVYVSGLEEERVASRRLQEFLDGLDPDDARAVARWFAEEVEGT